MTVLVLMSLPAEKIEIGRVAGEFDLCEAAWALQRALPEAAFEFVRGTLAEVVATIDRHNPSVVFNACEAPLGRPDLEAHVAAVLEWLGVPFTGNSSETLALCRRKDLTRAVLHMADIPIPAAGGLPCIVKCVDEDGSVGISRDSICADAASRDFAVARFNGHALVEEYLVGREFAVALWGGRAAEHYAIGEWHFTDDVPIVTYRAKWQSADGPTLRYDGAIDEELSGRLIATARNAWAAVGARGYARIDIRLDGGGLPRVIDVNPNPELGPESGMGRAVAAAGWDWMRFVRQQLTAAQEGYSQ